MKSTAPTGASARTRELMVRTAVGLMQRGQTPSVSAAAEAAGVSRATVYAWAERDAKFARAWREAREVGLDAIEDSILAASLKDWRAALAILRTFRPQWRHRCPGCEQREADARRATAKESLPAGQEAASQDAYLWLLGIAENLGAVPADIDK